MTQASHKPRLVVGMSGASGPQLTMVALQQLRKLDAVETHFVMSDGAESTLRLEAGLESAELRSLADVSYDAHDLGAAISSGSFRTVGMVVIPCSMRTLGAIASGNSAELLTRAADVTLKERRPLVLVTRESPLNLIHIRNMETVTLAGGTIFPPVVGFYQQPRSVEDILLQIVSRVLDQFGIDNDLSGRWHGGPG